nr:MAG TPA: hypothetical protein [Caudoviricetes sp.]
MLCMLNLIYIDSAQVYQNCCVNETVLIHGCGVGF